MEFANKEYLLLLLLIIPYLIWYVLYRKKTEPTMRMSDTFDAAVHAAEDPGVHNGGTGAGSSSDARLLGK